MEQAILGRKIGMTRVFDDNGNVAPVTVIAAGPCTVLGYTPKNIRLGFEDVEDKKVRKPQLGMFKKLNVNPKRVIQEFKRADQKEELKVGDQITVEIFKKGDFVDVIGTSIGKGFQGGMKRWNWMGQPAAHGSMSHRRTGSMGSNTDPGRVFKGKHLHGHMGNIRCTTQNLRVVKVDPQNNLILILGSVPGHSTSLVVIRKAKKKQNKVKQA